jgi:hypothetical protein
VTTPLKPTPPRRAARDLIHAVVENMRRNLEPLKYSTLAPSRYVVYLHPAEFSRLEEIVPVLRDETARALNEELQKQNAGTLTRRVLERVTGPAPPVQNPAGNWQIEFMADPDGEVAEGDILVQSDLVLGEREELGAGQRTRRVATMHVGGRTTVRRDDTSKPQPTGSRAAVARLTFTDDSGQRTFDMLTDTISIGRGGAARRVDLRIDSSADVSREHCAIRRDPSGRFYVSDFSMLGTTVNGTPVPRGYEELDGVRRPTGVEMPLPDRARVGLADLVFLDFEILPRR